MFSVGDKVLYPMHGAGVIERIEEREVLGETVRFYVITLPFGGMMVSIPVERNQEVGLRPVVEEAEARRIGCPVLIKARAGGGGRGIRRVDSPEAARAAYQEAYGEALAAFGDGECYICLLYTSSTTTTSTASPPAPCARRPKRATPRAASSCAARSPASSPRRSRPQPSWPTSWKGPRRS